MKFIQSKLLSTLFGLTCVVAIAYYGIGVYNQIRPKSKQEKAMDCLKLPTDGSVIACIKLITNNK